MNHGLEKRREYCQLNRRSEVIVELEGEKKLESKTRLGANRNYAACFPLVTSFHTRKRACKIARYSSALKR